jgi:hypothetical protein
MCRSVHDVYVSKSQITKNYSRNGAKHRDLDFDTSEIIIVRLIDDFVYKIEELIYLTFCILK